MPIQWYFRKDGQEHGPVTSADLRMLVSVGMLLPTDSVRKANMTRWAPTSALKGLFPAVAPSNQFVATKSLSHDPQAGSEGTPEEPDPTPPPSRSLASSIESNRKPKWIFYLTAAAALFAAVACAYRFMLKPADTNTAAQHPEPINRPAAADAILASQSVDPLVLAISSQSPFDRGMAFRQVKSTAVSPQLRDQVHQIICDTLDDRAFSSIWPSAARALGEVGSPADLPRLKPLIESAPLETQCAAMATSMVLDPDLGIKLFEPRAGDERFASTTAGCLADWGSRCEPVAIAMLKSTVPTCRYYALYLLKEFGTSKSLNAIADAKRKASDMQSADGYQLTIDSIQSRNQ